MSASGSWKTMINSPIGVQEGTLDILTSNDTFKGTMKGRAGAQEISGTVQGNVLTWTASITQPVPATLEFNVTVEGDSMTGSVKAGAFGTSQLTGVRA